MRVTRVLSALTVFAFVLLVAVPSEAQSGRVVKPKKAPKKDKEK